MAISLPSICPSLSPSLGRIDAEVFVWGIWSVNLAALVCLVSLNAAFPGIAHGNKVLRLGLPAYIGAALLRLAIRKSAKATVATRLRSSGHHRKLRLSLGVPAVRSPNSRETNRPVGCGLQH